MGLKIWSSYEWDIDSPYFQLAAARAIAVVRLPEALSMLSSGWDALGWGQGQITVWSASGSLPALEVAQRGSDTVVNIDGTRNYTQAFKYVAGANISASPKTFQLGDPFLTQSAGRTGVNKVFWGWSGDLHLRFEREGYYKCERIIFCGHSMGAALAACMVARLKLYNWNGVVELMTFGGPRIGNDAFNSFFQGVRIRRIINSGDPIPDLPPTELSIDPLHPRNVLPPNMYASNVVDLPGGVLMEVDGEQRNVANTPQPPNNIIQELGNYLVDPSSPNAFVDAHIIEEYRKRLERRLDTYEKSIPSVKAELAALRAIAMHGSSRKSGTPLLINTGTPRYTVNNTRGVVAGSLITSEVKLMAKIPVIYLPKKNKVGDQWQVVWINRVIYSGPSYSKCKTLIKRMTQWLKRMQLMEWVNKETFVESMTDYLDAATTAGSGFEPILQFST